MYTNAMIEAFKADNARLIASFDEPEAQSSTIEAAAGDTSAGSNTEAGGSITKLNDEEYWWYRNHICHASEMIMTTPAESPTLLEPILPRQGVVALVGSSDSGKSSLLRGLAMAIVSGKEEYIGFRLNTRYRRAIYVSTEDDQLSIGSLMRRQTGSPTGLEAMEYDGLHFIFDTDNLLATLELGLKSYVPDVVIIDAFADLYGGPMNENNRVRGFLQAFSLLATKYDTLFIFLHHTGKRTESLAPSKHNAIGSQGFEAKMRLMMELRPDPVRHDIRHLCIVKGNYLPAEYKHDSFELRFDESLNYTATGERVPFALLRERNFDAEAEEAQKLELIRSMREEGMTYQQIADELGYKDGSSIQKKLKNAGK